MNNKNKKPLKVIKKELLTCGKCKLWDSKEKICTVVIMDEGEKYELQTLAKDHCKWEEMGVDVQRMRAWSDGKDGFIEWTEDPNSERGIDPFTEKKVD